MHGTDKVICGETYKKPLTTLLPVIFVGDIDSSVGVNVANVGLFVGRDVTARLGLKEG